MEWFDYFGVGSIGIVYGWVLFWVLKQYLPPIAETPTPFKELFPSLIMLVFGGSIGSVLTELHSVSYIGPYGVGFLIGSISNLGVTFLYFHRQSGQRLNKGHMRSSDGQSSEMAKSDRTSS